MGTFISICERYNAEPIILCRYLDDIILEQGLSDPNVCVYAMDSENTIHDLSLNMHLDFYQILLVFN